MPLYFALKVPLRAVNLLTLIKWATSTVAALERHHSFYCEQIWKHSSVSEFLNLQNWKVNLPWGIISMLSISSISWDSIPENKFLWFSWCLNHKFLRLRSCLGMALMQMRQKTLHFCQVIVEVKSPEVLI